MEAENRCNYIADLAQDELFDLVNEYETVALVLILIGDLYRYKSEFIALKKP